MNGKTGSTMLPDDPQSDQSTRQSVPEEGRRVCQGAEGLPPSAEELEGKRESGRMKNRAMQHGAFKVGMAYARLKAKGQQRGSGKSMGRKGAGQGRLGVRKVLYGDLGEEGKNGQGQRLGTSLTVLNLFK